MVASLEMFTFLPMTGSCGRKERKEEGNGCIKSNIN
jgi:hypothetical protein